MPIRLIIRRRDAGEAAAHAEQTFDGPIVTIGSDAAASLQLSGPGIAAEQAIIIGGEGEPPLFINRADGTLLNGESLAREARRPLSDGDSISVGAYVIILQGNGFNPGAVAHGLAADAPHADAGHAAPNTRETPALPDADAPATPRQQQQAQQPTSFAAILDSLRTEEDTFYFQVETATAGRRRVPVEATGLLLGWDGAGQNVACGYGVAVETVRAVVHKDWSGVVLQPEESDSVAVNGEPVEAARRLRNGDRVTLRPVAGAAPPDTARNFFIFYEPASLVVLDSLLPPQQLPPPVAPPARAEGEAATAALVHATTATPPAVRTPARQPLTARTYFGYFTLGEVALMACATIAAAFVIFLILEYS
jgi:pSer/pThr/pTyr-binding forkhead associated (FHA) protein